MEQLADFMRNSADVRQRLPKVKTYCLHSYVVLTLLTIFLLCFFHLSVLSYSYFMSRFIPIMISNGPCDVFLNPSADCCARSSPSDFRHFQPESARKNCTRPHEKSTSARVEVPQHPCGKSVSFRTTIRGCPRGTAMEFLGKSYIMQHYYTSTS